MNNYDADDRDPRRFDRHDEPTVKRDLFDRLLAANENEPHTKPATVQSVEAIPPTAQTYVVQTYRIERGFYAFVQMIDAEGRARFVLPPKVTAALYRQRDALVTAERRQRGRDRWASLSPAERATATAHLRGKGGKRK